MVNGVETHFDDKHQGGLIVTLRGRVVLARTCPVREQDPEPLSASRQDTIFRVVECFSLVNTKAYVSDQAFVLRTVDVYHAICREADMREREMGRIVGAGDLAPKGQ